MSGRIILLSPKNDYEREKQRKKELMAKTPPPPPPPPETDFGFEIKAGSFPDGIELFVWDAVIAILTGVLIWNVLIPGIIGRCP